MGLSAGALSVVFRLEGPLERLVIAPPAGVPERRHGLWEHTCFEFFLRLPGVPGYREFNLSPAGHWNVFRFSGYRQGMAADEAFSALPFNVECISGRLLLTAVLPLAGNAPRAALSAAGPDGLEAAVSTVLVHADGTTAYWALAHPGPEPDFHHVDAFRLVVPCR